MKKPQRSLLLINRHSRQGSRLLSQIIDKLQDLGIEVIYQTSSNPLSIPDTILKYKNDVDSVIIGGGDGTLNLAVDTLVETKLPLGILPLGTANDLARTLNIPHSIDSACEIIAQGNQHQIDLGWVNGKYFFNVASIGLSVEITQKLTTQIKRKWGIFAYAITALKAIFNTRTFSAKIKTNGESVKVKTIQIAIGNGLYYGGGMAIAQDATIDDQRLDLYSIEINKWWQILRLFPALRKGLHLHQLGIRYLQAEEIMIYTKKPRPINTDGEITAYTPAHFKVIPQGLSVFIPQIK
jgi:diacylglycerol kinase (ATP)